MNDADDQSDPRPSWQQILDERLTTPDEALSTLRRGSRIFIGSGSGEPTSLIDELTRRVRKLSDIEIFHLLPLRRRGFSSRKLRRQVRQNVFSVQPRIREQVRRLRADYTPALTSDIPRLFTSRRLPLDLALIRVSPPNAHGYCSFGVSVDVTKTAAEAARKVVAEINPHMPRTHGDTLIHVSQLDAIVESNEPLIELEYEEIDEVAAEIARLTAKLIENGSTLSMSSGTISAALCSALRHRRHLGLHTEVVNDCVIDLVESGVIDNARKTVNRGRCVVSACTGSRKVYDYVNDNPVFYFRPTAYTNDPANIAANPKMVSIAPAREIDLTGQAAIESLPPYLRAGLTGPTDFLRGAARSDGGKALVVLPSLDELGRSRIVVRLGPHHGTVATASDVHHVVTENGIANLRGRSVRERAIALIQLADPRYRQTLYLQAKEEGLIYPDQIAPPEAGKPYPEQFEAEVGFGDDLRIFFRPAKPTDERRVQDFFFKHSKRTIYYRFHGTLEVLPRKDLQEFVNIDYAESMTLVGLVEGEVRGKRIVALGQYFLNPATNMAEVAFMVNDDYQNRGIGTWLLLYLVKIARQHGIAGFYAEVLPQNQQMLRVFQKSGFPFISEPSEDAIRVSFSFGKGGPDLDEKVEITAFGEMQDTLETSEDETGKDNDDG